MYLTSSSTSSLAERRLALVAAVWLLAACVTGCGFHLRGTGEGAVAVDRIHLVTESGQGEFRRMLRESLRRAGVELLGPADAPYSLHVLNERSTRRPLTLSSGGATAEYELRLEVSFELSAAGETVLAPTALSVQRTYSFDRDSLVGNTEEERLLTDEMRRELAGQVIRRIDAVVRARRSA